MLFKRIKSLPNPRLHVYKCIYDDSYCRRIFKIVFIFLSHIILIYLLGAFVTQNNWIDTVSVFALCKKNYEPLTSRLVKTN